MGKQAQELTKSDKDDIREIRKAKVLSLHSQGYGERAIAEKLLIPKSTVHADIAEMRKEALAGVEEYVQNFPYEWQKAKTTMDGLIQRAYSLAERNDLDFDQQVKIIELLQQMTFNRLKVYAEPQVIRRAAEHSIRLKEELDKLKKSGGKWEATTEYDKGEKVRKWKPKKKDEDIEIVV